MALIFLISQNHKNDVHFRKMNLEEELRKVDWKSVVVGTTIAALFCLNEPPNPVVGVVGGLLSYGFAKLAFYSDRKYRELWRNLPRLEYKENQKDLNKRDSSEYFPSGHMPKP